MVGFFPLLVTVTDIFVLTSYKMKDPRRFLQKFLEQKKLTANYGWLPKDRSHFLKIRSTFTVILDEHVTYPIAKKVLFSSHVITSCSEKIHA